VGRTLDPKLFERDSTKSSVDDLIFESGWRKFFEQLEDRSRERFHENTI
jgi:hypothetical protein